MGSGPTDPAEPYFDKGLWGFDGSQWYKLAMLWGYSDRYVEIVTEENVSAGKVTVNLTVVPAGEVWVIESLQGQHGTAVERVDFQVGNATDGYHYVGIETQTAGGLSVFWTGRLTLKAGDKVVVIFRNCTAGEDLIASAWGYKMEVAL